MGEWIYNHVCFEVEDIEAAAVLLSRQFGAGPFFLREHASPDELIGPDGQPGDWDHSHALGGHGSQLIELNQTHSLEPPALAAALKQGPVSHIAYTVSDLQRESDRLEREEAPRVLFSRSGPVTLAYHRSSVTGLVELLQAAPFMTSYRAAILAESRRWDGTSPLRADPPR